MIRPTIVYIVAAVGLGLGLAGCASAESAPAASTTAQPVGGTAYVGDLVITNALIPAPASPDVAAAYFTISNRGPKADRLLSVSSAVSADTGLHAYQGSTMVGLAGLDIPANQSAQLRVGGTHVMIMKPEPALTVGQRIVLTLTFRTAGKIDVPALVITGTGPGDDRTTPSGMSPMAGMS